MNKMKKELIGSIDRITEQTAYIVLNDDEHELPFPVELLPEGADEAWPSPSPSSGTKRKNRS